MQSAMLGVGRRFYRKLLTEDYLMGWAGSGSRTPCSIRKWRRWQERTPSLRASERQWSIWKMNCKPQRWLRGGSPL